MFPYDRDRTDETGRNEAPPRRLRLTGLVALAVAIVLVVVGLVVRASQHARLRDWAEAQAVPMVSVGLPQSTGDTATLVLPARLEAFARAPLYARVSGYLQSWKVDIGAPVRAGQLMAEIEAPDLDQQLAQARANLATAEANLALSASTAQRWQSMLGSDAVSRQEVDEKAGDLAAKRALVVAERANADRLQATKAFTRIVAPFDGVVTARDTDVGQLINAGVGSQRLFVVADVRRLRAYVEVPQYYALSIGPGVQASVTVPERPGKSYPAMWASSSQSVEASSGTTLMQLSVDNSERELMPGAYAQVTLDLPGRPESLSIPASALIFDARGLQVALVGNDNRVVIKPVTITRDLGKTVEIGSGLLATDRVIESPPDGLTDGLRVRLSGNANSKKAPDTGKLPVPPKKADEHG